MRAIPMPPEPGHTAPVAVDIALRASPQTARQADRRLTPHQFASARQSDKLTLLIDHIRALALYGTAERARFHGMKHRAGNNATAHLSTAGVVDDRRAPAANLVEHPHPRAVIPGLAGRQRDP